MAFGARESTIPNRLAIGSDVFAQQTTERATSVATGRSLDCGPGDVA